MCVTEVVRQGRLRWFGHLERKGKDEWVSACRNVFMANRLQNIYNYTMKYFHFILSVETDKQKFVISSASVKMFQHDASNLER